MKSLLFFLSFIFTAHAFATNLAEVKGDEASNFQESAFIKLMAELNNGQIPYPFKNLMESLDIGDNKDSGTVLLIPDGRSLVKKYADYKNPRIIVNPLSLDHTGTVSDPKKIAMMNKLNLKESDIFIGYAPNHNALEVISFNSKTQSFDFFIVENYEAGKTPKIVSSPAQCMSCHQNGAPIFSRFPWMEASGDSGIEVVNSLLTEESSKKGVKLLELIRKANPDRTTIEGINIGKNSKIDFFQVAKFDGLVRAGNFIMLRNKVCETMCASGDVNCLKNLISNSVAVSRNEAPENVFDYDLKDLQKRIESIDQVSSAIPNRDPAKNLSYETVVTDDILKELPFLENSDITMKNYDVTFLETGASNVGKHELDNPKSDFSFSDPTRKRPLNSDLVELQTNFKNSLTSNKKVLTLARMCLNMNHMDGVLQGVSKEQLSEILNRPSILKVLKKYRDLSVSDLPLALEKELKTISYDEQVDSVCEDTQQRAVVPIFKFADLQKINDQFNTQEIGKPTALFNKYCMECHGENGFIKLPLNSPEGMANYKPQFSEKAVLERLEKKIMPPSFANAQPTDEERKRLVELMRQLKK